MNGPGNGRDSRRSPLRSRVQTLLESQGRDEAPTRSEFDWLCRAAADGLELAWAVITLTTSAGPERIGVSDDAAAGVAEIEFSIGEGPILDVLRTHRPALAPDLGESSLTVWPAYGRAALDRGVASVFVFPLHVGAAYFGALSLFGTAPGPLGGDRLRLALTFAEVATEQLLDTGHGPDGMRCGVDLDAAMDAHAEVYQAQGMLMVQLGIGLPDALARLRAYAFGSIGRGTGAKMTRTRGEV